MIARTEHHGKAPPSKNKPSTPEEKSDKAARRFMRTHEWTQAEIDALPDVSREVVTKVIEKQKSGEDLKRTTEEALANMIARIEHHGEAPPTKFRPSTPEEKADYSS